MRIESFFQKFDGESLTYDDLILLPKYVDFPLESVDFMTQLTRDIRLNIPIVSSPMDTVTESELAIAIALQGGIGIIHYNMSPEEQLKQLQKVKRFQNGFVLDPITLPPTAALSEAVAIRREFGYSTIPITADGDPHGVLVGMLSKNDYSTFSDDAMDKQVWERMLPLKDLPFATVENLSHQGAFDLAQANERLLSSHSAALPIVDSAGCLRYLITRSDLEKHQKYPRAALDSSKALLVGAAIETWREKAEERIQRIKDAVDVIVFDTSQGFTRYELDLIRWTKREFPHLQMIGGNVVTPEACDALIAAGADGIRVGMGSGSICTTQEIGGIGRAQATAVYACAKSCRKANVPLLADGGISKSADIVKALSLGADAVMLGSLLACTSEAPGRIQIKNGIRLKEYRGMGSLKAMERGSSARYGTQSSVIRVPEGVSGLIPSRGSIAEWVPCLLQGVKQGLHKLGYPSIVHLHQCLARNLIELERRSEPSQKEGQVHSLYEVQEEEARVSSKASSFFTKTSVPLAY